MSEGDIDTGQTVGGEGWDRKELTLAGSDADNVLFSILKEYTISPSYGSM